VDVAESALALIKAGETPRAIELIEHASVETRQTQSVQRVHAIALAQSKRWDEAQRSIESALQHPEVSPATHGVAAKLFEDSGRYGDAFEHYAALLKVQPGQAAFWRGLWRCSGRSTDPTLGTRALNLSLAAKLDLSADVGLSVSVVNALLRQTPNDERIRFATSLAKRTHARHPADSVAQHSLVSLSVQSDPLHAFEQIAELDATVSPEQPLTAERIDTMLALPQIHASEASLARWLERYQCALHWLLRPGAHCSPEHIRGTSFYLAFQECDLRALQTRRGQWLRKVMQPHVPPPLGRVTTRGERKTRVGFVSKHLRDCTVGQYFRRFVTDLNTSQHTEFEVHVFCCGQRDVLSDEIATSVHAFHHFPVDGDENYRMPTLTRIAESIKASELDAVVYPEVGMEPLIEKLAAMRLAPLQCAFWGHPVTTGLESVDIFLSAEAMEPPDARTHYSERLHLLPGLGTSYPTPPAAGTISRAELQLPEHEVLLVCAQSSFKWTPRFVDALCDIMGARADIRLVYFRNRDPLSAFAFASYLRKCFAERGINADQVLILLPETSRTRFISILAACDIALDTFGFSGGNSSLDALSVGLPIVTLPGLYMRGRQTMAMLQTVAAPELIASDVPDYVAKVLALIDDEDTRQRLRRRITSAAPNLFNDPAPLAAFRDFLRGAIAKQPSANS
jgi:tetratricopeptide (TPR) repeat protein